MGKLGKNFWEKLLGKLSFNPLNMHTRVFLITSY